MPIPGAGIPPVRICRRQRPAGPIANSGFGAASQKRASRASIFSETRLCDVIRPTKASEQSSMHWGRPSTKQNCRFIHSKRADRWVGNESKSNRKLLLSFRWPIREKNQESRGLDTAFPQPRANRTKKSKNTKKYFTPKNSNQMPPIYLKKRNPSTIPRFFNVFAFFKCRTLCSP